MLSMEMVRTEKMKFKVGCYERYLAVLIIIKSLFICSDIFSYFSVDSIKLLQIIG